MPYIAKSQCHAKVPAKCRYHGAIIRLNELETAIQTGDKVSFDDYYSLRKEIEEQEANGAYDGGTPVPLEAHSSAFGKLKLPAQYYYVSDRSGLWGGDTLYAYATKASRDAYIKQYKTSRYAERIISVDADRIKQDYIIGSRRVEEVILRGKLTGEQGLQKEINTPVRD